MRRFQCTMDDGAEHTIEAPHFFDAAKQARKLARQSYGRVSVMRDLDTPVGSATGSGRERENES